MAVRKAKVGRYEVRKGGGGCHPQLDDRGVQWRIQDLRI